MNKNKTLNAAEKGAVAKHSIFSLKGDRQI